MGDLMGDLMANQGGAMAVRLTGPFSQPCPTSLGFAQPQQFTRTFTICRYVQQDSSVKRCQCDLEEESANLSSHKPGD